MSWVRFSGQMRAGLAVFSLLLQPRASLELAQGILVADAWPRLLALVRQPPIEPIEFVIGQTFQGIRYLFGLFGQQRRDDPYVGGRVRFARAPNRGHQVRQDLFGELMAR